MKTLSDKIILPTIKTEDVKQFIKDLKEMINRNNKLTGEMVYCLIDKLAGEKLI